MYELAKYSERNSSCDVVQKLLINGEDSTVYSAYIMCVCVRFIKIEGIVEKEMEIWCWVVVLVYLGIPF